MNLKSKISRDLMKATSDKAELNQSVLRLKKRFDEAEKVIGTERRMGKGKEKRRN